MRVGALDGAPCEHATLVDLRAGVGTAGREVGVALERLCTRTTEQGPACGAAWPLEDPPLAVAELLHGPVA